MTDACLSRDLADGIATLTLNRPDKSNAFDRHGARCARRCNGPTTPRGARGAADRRGQKFCAGIDLAMLLNIQQSHPPRMRGRSARRCADWILQLQDDISSLERCRKPVIAAIHGACIGGIDLVTAADIRFASADAYFAVREIDMGMTADVGTLQRLPRIVGEGVARELCLTGRRIDAAEAAQLKLVNQVFDSQDALLAHARQVAASIAGKSPLAVRGTKQVLNYSRDHSVADSLDIRGQLERRHAVVQRYSAGGDGQHEQAHRAVCRLINHTAAFGMGIAPAATNCSGCASCAQKPPPPGRCLTGVLHGCGYPCGFDGKFTATDPLTRHEQNFVPKANLDLLFVRDKFEITGYWPALDIQRQLTTMHTGISDSFCGFADQTVRGTWRAVKSLTGRHKETEPAGKTLLRQANAEMLLRRQVTKR